jgi:hypothetical protein
MLNKSARGIVVSALVLLSLFAALPQPAHGTPPEDLRFELDLVFQLGNFTGTGSWHSLGILQASGHALQDEQLAGYDESGWFVRNLHSTATLCNSTEGDCKGVEDTITIRSHILNLDFVPYGPASGDGWWFITEATGAYEGLHGNGTAHFSGSFHFSCPDPAVLGPCLTEKLRYDGQGHFDP